MASILRHIGLDLTPQNSDPAKIRDIGAPELKQRPKGNFRGSGLNFAVLRLTLTSPRKARAVYVDKSAKTTG